jgi:DNA polymerase-3 subunit gamma/tau
VTTALYRRYRPETFGEMIGQSQVTEPLMTALRGDRVGHAYLFSGPRGCGKTTSARVLARCLNCAEGPTDVPCGVCDSCVELGRDGGGSLDVVEIDAASHNGVDDARDLRERAVFAPARDRFKIFILDEAHMVTPQGFNALLKLVEEPPEHVKFIFATTEPEKVIGTIRSRTHHYPFRLVPPAAMLDYVQTLCETEGVTVEPGVLSLVVRAGGGSPRDTLSLLDQLIAGSEGTLVTYARAVALLGYTHAELLDEVVDAFGAADAAAAFAAVDRVVQTGQDPRRFVDDLLERLRDLIIVDATGQDAASVLRGVSADELARMMRQADVFGSLRLTRTADLVIATLDEMTGATSPRLQLELMVARVLAQTGSAPVAAAPAQAPAAASPAQAPTTATPVPTAPAPAAPEPARASVPAPAPPRASVPEHDRAPAAAAPAPAPAERSPAPSAPAPAERTPAPTPAEPVTLQHMKDAWPEVLSQLEEKSRSSWLLASGARVVELNGDVLTLAFQSVADVAQFKKLSAGSGPSEDLRQAILAVLGIRVKYLAKHDTPHGSAGGAAAPPVTERGAPTASSSPPASPPRAASHAAAPVTEWAVAAIPRDDDAPPADMPESPTAESPTTVAQFAVDDEPEDAAAPGRARVSTLAPPREGDVLPAREVEPSIEPEDDDSAGDEMDAAPDAPVPPVVARPLPAAAARPVAGSTQRYGEAVVRQVLGARFVREEPYEPPTRFS